MTECVICLDPINGPHVTTPCNHKMHNKCLTQWLLTEDTCPLCRHDIGIKSSSYDEEHDPEFIQLENVCKEKCSAVVYIETK